MGTLLIRGEIAAAVCCPVRDVRIDGAHQRHRQQRRIDGRQRILADGEAAEGGDVAEERLHALEHAVAELREDIPLHAVCGCDVHPEGALVLGEVGEDRVERRMQLVDAGRRVGDPHAHRLADLIDAALEQRGVEVLLVAEEVVQRTDRDLGAFRHLVDGGAMEAAFGQHRLGGLEDDFLSEGEFALLA